MLVRNGALTAAPEVAFKRDLGKKGTQEELARLEGDQGAE